MFAVQKTDRFFDPSGQRSSVTELLGPGSYNNGDYHAIKKSKPAVAGFGKSERAFEDPASSVRKNPAPGAYEIKGSIVVDRRKISAPFRSGTQRLKAPAPAASAATPGPGAYLQQASGFGRVSHRAPGVEALGAPEEPAVRWERVPTAPSIPTRKQCFGYEEGPDGELVLQRMVNHGYGGMTHEDSAGPADYRPNVSVTKPMGRVVDFAKTGGHSTFDARPAEAGYLGQEQAYHAPRPGQLAPSKPDPRAVGADTSGGAPTRDGAPRKSAVFSSAVGRTRIDVGDKLQADATPGPGTYYRPIPAFRRSIAQLPSTFGSNAPRFEDELRTMSASKAAPGPGQYLGTESTWDKRQRARARHLGPKHGGRAPGAPPPRGGGIAFDSTSTRFDGRGLGGRSATAAGASIGPGSYDHPGLAEDVGKRLTSRTGAFGTSTRRFASQPGEATRLAMPGPGEYDDEFAGTASQSTLRTPSLSTPGRTPGRGARVTGPALSTYRNKPRPKPTRGVGSVKPSSYFASDTSRTSLADTRPARDAVPPPGAYELKTEWRAARGVAKLGSGPVARFTEAASMTSQKIGPGAYSMPTTIKPGKPGRKNLMLSSAPRFGAGGFAPGTEADEAPGPGAYDYEMPYGNLLKPTYNVAIAEQCREIVF